MHATRRVGLSVAAMVFFAAASARAQGEAPTTSVAAEAASTASGDVAATTQAAAPVVEAAVPAPVVTVDDEMAVVAWLGNQVDAAGRPCLRPQLSKVNDIYYVACGLAGLWSVRAFDTGYTVLERRQVGAEVVGLFATSSELYVRVKQSEGPGALVVTLPLSSLSSATTARMAASTTSVVEDIALGVRGRVVQVGPGYALVNFGKKHGVELGRHVMLSAPVPSTMTEPHAARELVGKVSVVEDGRSRVDLGLNEWVEVGYLAEVSYARVTATNMAPPKAISTWDMTILTRPFLTIDDLGVGALLDANVGMRPMDLLRLDVRLEPFGIATGKQGGVASWALYGTASFDHRYFAAGLGVGAQRMNAPESSDRTAAVVGSFLQEARIGALDGVSLRATSTLAVNNLRFEFSALRLFGRIPLGPGRWLVPACGAGTAGYAFAEMGFRALVGGNGEQDSMFLTATLGGTGMFDDYGTPSTFGSTHISYAGLHMGLGVEYRL